MSEQVHYKAKEACRIGGAFRKAGDVFPLPRFETTPPYLEEVPEPVAETSAPDDAVQGPPAPGRRKGPKPTTAGPMPADMPGVVRD